jgi:DNA transposition AAA+ family ATPase
MTHEHKKEIKKLLMAHIAQFSSQKKGAASLQDVSESTVINIKNDKWESVSDNMWRNIWKQVGFNTKGVWNYAPVASSKMLMKYLQDAGESGNTYGIIAKAGGTKTFTTEQFCKQNENTFHIQCSEYFNRKVFLQRIMDEMGKENQGYTVAEMMEEIVKSIMPMESPVIVLDEVDKLPDPVFYFFITLYNQLSDKCGMVLMATDFLAKRIDRGIRINKKGYKEIFSRLGRRFIHLKEIEEHEVAEICKANGLTEAALIKEVWNECEGDLRRVKRMVYKLRKREAKMTAQKAA